MENKYYEILCDNLTLAKNYNVKQGKIVQGIHFNADHIAELVKNNFIKEVELDGE